MWFMWKVTKSHLSSLSSLLTEKEETGGERKNKKIRTSFIYEEKMVVSPSLFDLKYIVRLIFINWILFIENFIRFDLEGTLLFLFCFRSMKNVISAYEEFYCMSTTAIRDRSTTSSDHLSHRLCRIQWSGIHFMLVIQVYLVSLLICL